MQNLPIHNHRDFQDLRALKASNKTVLSINANAVLITKVIDIIFLPNAHPNPFAAVTLGFHSIHLVGD